MRSRGAFKAPTRRDQFHRRHPGRGVPGADRGELTRAIDAEPGERSSTRPAQRNGHRPKLLSRAEVEYLEAAMRVPLASGGDASW
jgi:hypothetical protein